MAIVVSPALMRRVMVSRRAAPVAAPIASSAAHWMPSPVGRSMTIMPANPTETASQRCQPTRSPRNSGPKAVIISGARNNSAVASTSGISRNAPTNMNEAATMTARASGLAAPMLDPQLAELAEGQHVAEHQRGLDERTQKHDLANRHARRRRLDRDVVYGDEEPAGDQAQDAESRRVHVRRPAGEWLEHGHGQRC